MNLKSIIGDLKDPVNCLNIVSTLLCCWCFMYFTAKGIAKHDVVYFFLGICQFFLALSNILSRRKSDGNS